MIALILLMACNRDTGTDTGPALDTGWFTDTDDWRCADRVMSTTPSDGESSWYWRDPLAVRTATRETTAYDAWLVDADGVRVPSVASWVPDLPELTVVPDAPLAPSSSFALVTQDCEGLHFTPFGTSSLGEPLDPEILIDATFAVRLQDAVWDEPSGLGGLIALYLDWPVLLGVQFANDDIVDLIGAQGYLNTDGNPRQIPTEPTWDYPLSSFATAPFVDATADAIVISASQSVDLPVYDFRLQATFAADGQSLGGARVSGLGDTRNLGTALDMGEDAEAVCNAATAFGVTCVPCPDGLPVCLDLAARNVSGARVPGITVYAVGP